MAGLLTEYVNYQNATAVDLLKIANTVITKVTPRFSQLDNRITELKKQCQFWETIKAEEQKAANPTHPKVDFPDQVRRYAHQA